MKTISLMKRNHLILMAIALVLGMAFFGCKKQEIEILTPKITNDKVEATSTTATFTWTVDWPGKLISVVEVSENEDMTHSQCYGSETETENHNFSVTVTDMKEATKYYYRYLVWNKYYEDNKYEFEVKSTWTPPVGGISGLFSVSATKQVWFSQGNLQYRATTNTWRFAENQWNYVGGYHSYYGSFGNVQGGSNSNISQDYSGWIDLFGWGTSGYNHGAICYQPWSTSVNSNDYYAYGSETSNLYDQAGKADWGYNVISNGGSTQNIWRTMTKDELEYLLFKRNTTSGIRFAEARVNDVEGLLLLPDNWSESTCALVNPNVDYQYGHYSDNEIVSSQWIILENAGAVFLPAAGDRRGITYMGNGIVNYWLSSRYNGEEAYSLCGLSVCPDLIWYGRSVRLVRDVF